MGVCNTVVHSTFLRCLVSVVPAFCLPRLVSNCLLPNTATTSNPSRVSRLLCMSMSVFHQIDQKDTAFISHCSHAACRRDPAQVCPCPLVCVPEPTSASQIQPSFLRSFPMKPRFHSRRARVAEGPCNFEVKKRKRDRLPKSQKVTNKCSQPCQADALKRTQFRLAAQARPNQPTQRLGRCHPSRQLFALLASCLLPHGHGSRKTRPAHQDQHGQPPAVGVSVSQRPVVLVGRSAPFPFPSSLLCFCSILGVSEN